MNSSYWLEEGTHVCTVEDCITGKHENDAGSKYVRFVLKNADNRYCNKNFVVTDASMRAIRSFGIACGLNLAQVKIPRKSDFVGKKVEVDVVMNSEGYPVPQHWRKPQDQKKETKADDEGEFLF